MKRSRWLTFITYLLLIGGSLLFVVPFVSMVATSFKTDRELYPEELTIMPQRPVPRLVSPYIDERFYDTLPGTAARQAELLPRMVELVRRSGFVIPESVPREVAETQLARGIYKRLAKRIDTTIWDGPVDGVIAAATPIVDRAFVAQSYDEIFRFLAVGTIRAKSAGDAREFDLGKDAAVSNLWTLQTPDVADVTPETRDGKTYLRVDYDFTEASRLTLTSEVDLPFDPATLRRIQVDLRPDDTWHAYRLFAEFNGRRFESRRDRPLGNFEWQSAAWQPASEEDNSTRIRDWVILDDVAPSASPTQGKLRLTLEIERSTDLAAWSHKLGQNYQRVFEQIPFWRYVRVSVFLVVANIVLNLIFSSLVAYSFARLTWPGRDVCFMLMLATMMIPEQVTMIPHFVIWKSVGLYNTLEPLWLAAAFGNAFHIFLLRQFMRSIPRDLEDSARLDGCGFLRVYWHVILPLIGPSLAAIAIFTFMGTWNNFMGPLLYIADQRLYPLAFGLYAFNIQVGANPALNMAGSVLMTLPVIAIFFFAQRYFIQGVTLTGLKG
jgi:ABC-type glycerol-3-phosphate transport system permease component